MPYNLKFNWSAAAIILFIVMFFTKETYDDHVREITSVIMTYDAKFENNQNFSQIMTDRNPFSNFIMFAVKAKLSQVATYTDYRLFSTISSSVNNKLISIGILGNVFVLIDEESYRAFKQQN